MKYLKLLLFIAGFILMLSCNKDDELPEGITYKVSFNFNWNSTDFPTDYPSNAHFSKLIGWSHNTTTTFFDVGTIASPGIESMAETGATETLESEINSRISKGEGHHLLVGDNLSSGIGTISAEIVVDENNPEVTLVTMIAPSPDWYVGAIHVNLFENGAFINSKSLTAHVYDSGTDSGVNYTSPNEDTSPKDSIAYFYQPPLGDGKQLPVNIATVTFSKK